MLDPTGGAIVGAEIRIANDATGVQYTGKTNDEGIYVVTNLPPGTYRLQVSKIGFKTLIKPDIILNVQDSLAINFTLPVGAAIGNRDRHRRRAAGEHGIGLGQHRDRSQLRGESSAQWPQLQHALQLTPGL